MARARRRNARCHAHQRGPLLQHHRRSYGLDQAMPRGQSRRLCQGCEGNPLQQEVTVPTLSKVASATFFCTLPCRFPLSFPVLPVHRSVHPFFVLSSRPSCHPAALCAIRPLLALSTRSWCDQHRYRCYQPGKESLSKIHILERAQTFIYL